MQEPSQDKDKDYSKEGRVYVEAKVKVNNKELTNLICCLKEKNYILTGDFNANKTCKYIKWIEKILVNNDTSNTWTIKPFSYNGFEETELNWKLDYIFTSKGIKVNKKKIIDTKYNDHLPVLKEVEL